MGSLSNFSCTAALLLVLTLPVICLAEVCSPDNWCLQNPLFNLEGVSAQEIWTNGKNDIFVVVEKGDIYHFDGNVWSQVTLGPSSSTLNKFWGSSGTDIFAVSYCQIFHYDGNMWSVVNDQCSPDGALYYETTTDIWGSSGSDVFAVGWYRASLDLRAPFVEHYDGNTWSRMSLPDDAENWRGLGQLESVLGSSGSNVSPG